MTWRASTILTAGLLLASCGGDDASTAGRDGTTSTSTSTSALPPATVLPVQAMVGGDELTLERACSGFDGAVVAVSDTGLRVLLVREGQLALRVGRAPTFAETDDVTVGEHDIATSYSGTVTWEGSPTPVVLTVLEGTDLAPCPEGSSES